jgi:hypothetical protein
MKESDTPQGQDNTPNNTNDAQNSGALSNPPPRVSGDPPSPPEHDHPDNDSGPSEWWRRLSAWTFIGEMVLIAITLYIACIYSGQLDQMIESNEINRESLESVQRAFMILNAIPFNRFTRMASSGTPELIWQFKPNWENAGNTTATTAAQDFFVELLPTEPNDEQFAGNNKEHTQFEIGPKARQNGGVKDIPDSVIMSARVDQPGAHKMFFWGWVVYRDVFPKTKPHVTEFCYHLAQASYVDKRQKPLTVPQMPVVPENISLDWDACKEHNCVDEYCKNYKTILSFLPELPKQ